MILFHVGEMLSVRMTLHNLFLSTQIFVNGIYEIVISCVAETVFLNNLIKLSAPFCPHISEMTPVVSNVELNPHARENAKICYDFLNGGKCRREKKNGLCYYRHLPENHIQSIVERIRSGRVGMREG